MCCFRRVRGNEEVKLLIGRLASDGAVLTQPLVISEGARADIRVRSQTHDPVHIGDPGGLWILYKPQGVLLCVAVMRLYPFISQGC